MKKIAFNRFAIAAASAALLAACSEDTPSSNNLPKGTQVNFVVETAVSRTTTSDDYSTNFVSGDQIGIFATGGAYGANALHYVGADGALTAEPGNEIYTTGDAPADFFAYYPYQAQVQGDAVKFSVNADQSTDQGFNSSDFLTATSLNQAVDGTSPISLKFSHRMAMVEVEFLADASKLSNVKLTNVQGTLTWNYASDLTVTDAAETTNVSMLSIAGKYRAMVPAQTIQAGTKLISADLDGTTYAFTAAAPISVEANKVKKFRIGISADGKLVAISADLEVNPWIVDPDEVSGDWSEVEPEPLMALESFDNLVFTDLDRNKEQIEGAGWYRFNSDTAADVIDIRDDGEGNNVMYFKRGRNSWYNGCFYYCAENVAPGKYAFTFKGKSTQAENMKTHQMRVGAYMQQWSDADNKYVDYFAMIDKDGAEVTYIMPQITAYESYGEYTITFDLSKVSTLHFGTAAQVTEESKIAPTEEMLKKVVFYFSVNDATGNEYWFDDFAITPVK